MSVASLTDAPVAPARFATGAPALKRALIAGVARVLASRDALNRINVFPVADGDTGSNLAYTLSAALEAARRYRAPAVDALMDALARGALDGARGNSGAILAQFLQGASEALAGATVLDSAGLARAADLGERQARAAVAQPQEGTMLSVIGAFARSLRASVDGAATPIDVRAAFARALAATREALADTPRQLAVLRKAGVVDAGAQGFVDLLEGIGDFIARGRASDGAVETGVLIAGVVADADSDSPEHRWCAECVLAAAAIDRGAVRAALDAIGGSSLVLAGTRERLRVHMHVDAPAVLFETLGAFGTVTARKADDMRAQRRATRATSDVAIVVDSAADLPPDAFESLPIHLVPVRLNFGTSDYLDKVSLSAREFYAELARNPEPVRTSQPPAGDFRRLFEFLLSHHAEVVYVGLSRAVSGTLQSGESAAAPFGARVRIVDTLNASGGHGLLARHAGERALEGADASTIADELERLKHETRTFAYVRDLRYAVGGGRIPRWSLPITSWLRLVPIARLGGGDGKLHVAGILREHAELPARFVARILRGIDRRRRWRAQVLHCDNAADGARVRDALVRELPDADVCDLLDAGSAIGAHAGPGAVVVALMPAEPRAR